MDFGNSTNWSNIYDKIANAPVTDKGHIPIEEIIIPVQTESSIVAAICSSQSAQDNWVSAGFLRVNVRAGLLTENNFDSILKSEHLLLEEIHIFQYPAVASSYALSFHPRRWLKDIHLTVFEYRGAIDDKISDQLDLIRIDLLRNEKKIDIVLDRI